MATKKTTERKDPKGVIDVGLSKVVSRKLLVWGTATVALFTGAVRPMSGYKSASSTSVHKQQSIL
jgi:hypothetical protein